MVIATHPRTGRRSGLRPAGALSRGGGLLTVVLLLGATAGALTRPGALAPALAAPSCPLLGGTQLTQTASVAPPGGNAFTVCRGSVRTFDGTPLDVDLTLPTVAYVPPGATTPAAPPLMTFLSGWSNDRCQFESTTLEGSGVSCDGNGDFIGNAGWHWNNAWFASSGWVVLTYTPRGWWESCGKDVNTGYSYALDPRCNAVSGTPGEASWVHLYDRRYEVRDAQYLDGLVVDAGLVNPSQMVVTGDSGGGGPSWDLALSQDQVVQLASTPDSVVTAPWTSPAGVRLHLAGAIPMYTWTDLVDALVSNGRASDGAGAAPPDGDRQAPVGVEKESYVDGLMALGTEDAQFAVPATDPTADLTTWFAEISAGEPYGPGIQTVIDQIGGPLRSPFAIPIPPPGERTPVFSIQGLTDPLFTGLQTLTMVDRLKAADPGYPVTAFLGDIGHSYAQNPLAVWQQAHDASNDWLTHVLAGRDPTQPTLTADTTVCVAGQTLQTLTGRTLSRIAAAQLAFSDPSTRVSVHAAVTSPPTATVEGAQTDPIVNHLCRTMPVSESDASPSQVSYAFPVTSSTTLAGSPVVSVTATFVGSTAGLAARLWDVDPAGNQTLVARSVYRLDIGSAASATLPVSFELSPNAWQLQAGHTVKLELTQDDFPSWRPDNQPATITLSGLTLTLPTTH